MTLQNLITAITIEDLGYILAFFAGILGSILTIWAFSSKVKQTRDNNIKLIVSQTLDEYDDKIDKKINCAVDGVEKQVETSLKRLEEQLGAYIKTQKEANRQEEEAIKLLKDSLVESYKQDIRSIYYTLRKTGEISDSDKSYVDKLFPKYIALGGNSDIEAKYSEMCRVYETITQENFEKAREKYMREKLEKERDKEGQKNE